ncbi:hypothetical protein GCM10023186_18890 [Hymenobacter koreensis]|uniref:Outer membrane protein beta-barrel domain-containing protein n=1 Tax=Hymenobacter koreensis TaxID=1084523 RepID=A0ABP8IYI2_9BACT
MAGLACFLSGSALAQVATGLPASPEPGLRAPRVSYSLTAGSTFAGRFGSATYLSPTANYQLTNRLRVFGGLTYLRAIPGVASPMAPGEGRAAGLATGTSHFLLHGGGTYALSPRLALTGSAWKDFTPNTGLRVSPYAGFGNMGTGINLRADYHITENLSVSGGVRVVQGTTTAPFNPVFSSPVGY